MDNFSLKLDIYYFRHVYRRRDGFSSTTWNEWLCARSQAFKTIVSPETSDRLLKDLQDFPENHALIAFKVSVDGLFD